MAASATFRAIADPTRREILSLLRGGPQTVGELASNFRTSRPAISKGAAHICRLNAKPLQAIGLWLREYEVFWGESLRGLKNYVEGTANQKETDL